MRLVQLEIAMLDWAGTPCGCGRSAGHVADDLLRVAQGLTHGIRSALDGHAWSAPVLFLPAPAVTSVALAALADDIPPAARIEFLDLLLCMVAGDGTDFEGAARGLDLPALCRDIATRGLWLLYEEVASGRSVPAAGTAFEILTVVEANRKRLHEVRESLGELLPSYCRSGSWDDEWPADQRQE
jgi:hypothetical protein